MDSDLESERDIERQFEGYQNQRHPWGALEFVIDARFFVSSNKILGRQIGDVCAYALHRYLGQGSVVGSQEESRICVSPNCLTVTRESCMVCGTMRTAGRISA
jgi:hypothetical protein